jgi:hypothetical protein
MQNCSRKTVSNGHYNSSLKQIESNEPAIDVNFEVSRVGNYFWKNVVFY